MPNVNKSSDPSSRWINTKQGHIIQWSKLENFLKSCEKWDKRICGAGNIENQELKLKELGEHGDSFIGKSELVPVRKVTTVAHISNFCEPNQRTDTSS